QIYKEFRETHEVDENVLGDEIREKTRQILEKHIEFGELDEGKEVEYEIPEREVEVVEDIDPEYDYVVVDEGGRMRHTYEREKEKNPVYSSLSDRVKTVMERWREDEIDAEKAMEELEEIKRAEEEIEDEKETKEMSEIEFALYKLLNAKYSQYVSGSDEAEQLAQNIGERVSDYTLEGNLSQIKRNLRSQIIQVLVDEGKKDLAKHEDKAFLEDAIKYIVANAEG
ncbi:MAG: hypothetical protein ABEJ72_01185, partial [Candidatus Aenigmatarchaeota archaeon]